MNILEFEVTGMTCISCSNTIRNILLRSCDYIETVEINIVINSVKVILNRKITSDEKKRICNAINNAGFKCTLKSGTMMSENMLSLSIDNVIGSLDENNDGLEGKSFESEILIGTSNDITKASINGNMNRNIKFIKLQKINTDDMKEIIKLLKNEKGIVSIIMYMKWNEVCILFDGNQIRITDISDMLSVKLGINMLNYIKFYTLIDNNKLNCVNNLAIRAEYAINSEIDNIIYRICNKIARRNANKRFVKIFTKSINLLITGLFGIYDINVENATKNGKVNNVELTINIRYNPYFISSRKIYNYLTEHVLRCENIIKDGKNNHKLIFYEQMVSNNNFNDNTEYHKLQKIKYEESRYYIIRFTISLILTILVLLLNYFGDNKFINDLIKICSFGGINSLKYEAIIPGISWNYFITLCLVTIIVYFCGYSFHKKGILGIVHLSPNMYTLISLGMNTCYIYSLYMMVYISIVSFHYSNLDSPRIYSDGFPNFFDTACILNTISTFGRILDIKSNLIILRILNGSSNKNMNDDKNNYKINNRIKLINNLVFNSLKKIYYDFPNNNNTQNNDNNNNYQILPSIIDENKTDTYSDYGMNTSSVSIDEDRFYTKSNQSVEMKEECFISNKNEINIDLVELGDAIILNKNEIVPFDGINISNEICILDESMITGETKVIEKLYGNYITGGSKVLSEKLILYITEIGSESTLGRIKKLKEGAKEGNIVLPSSIDIFSRYFIPIILTISLLSFIIWFILACFNIVNPKSIIKGDQIDFLMSDGNRDNIFNKFPISSKVMFALHFTLSILAISCPCVIGLTIPIAVLISTSITSKKNILVQNNNIIHAIGCMDYVIFDKTGTLTNGRPSVKSIIINHDNLKKINLENEEKSNSSFNPTKINVETFYICDINDNIDGLFRSFVKLWWIIGSCEYYNNHPAGSVLRSFSIRISNQVETNPSFSQPVNCRYHPGLGISCVVNNMKILLSNKYEENTGICNQNYILRSLDTTGYYNYINNYSKNIEFSMDNYKNNIIDNAHFNSSNNHYDLQFNSWYTYWKKQGSSVIFVFFNENSSESSEMKLLGAISLSDEPMFGVESTINYIKKYITKQIWLCSGDSYCTSNSIASMVGIDSDKIMCNSSPNDKLSLVRDLQMNIDLNKTRIDLSYNINLVENTNKETEVHKDYNKENNLYITRTNGLSNSGKKKKKKVMMIGDGLNDSASLEASDVGILLGKGGICNFTNADVIILSNYQHNLKYLFKLSR